MVLALILGTSTTPRQAAATRQTDASADVLILNGKVYTGDGSGTFQEAIAIRGTSIVAVGRTRDLEKLRGATTEVLDVGGRAVVPGFSDNHVHVLAGGFSLGQADLVGAENVGEAQERIRAFAKAHPEHAWIQGRG